jgi:hypothetical protein
MPPFPAYIGKGTFASGASAITVGAPANIQADDLILLCVETENTVIVLGDGSARWTQVPTVSPQSTGTANTAGGVRLGVYYRWSPNTTPGSQVVNDGGGHQTGIMIGIRGVKNVASSLFINDSKGFIKTANTNISAPNIVTTKPYCYVLNFVGLDKDAGDTDTITAWFPPTGSSNTREIHDQTVVTGAGGGVAIYGYEWLNTGNTGFTYGTGDSSTVRVYITLGLETNYQRRLFKS